MKKHGDLRSCYALGISTAVLLSLWLAVKASAQTYKGGIRRCGCIQL
jgi:hypothetical protein